MQLIQLVAVYSRLRPGKTSIRGALGYDGYDVTTYSEDFLKMNAALDTRTRLITHTRAYRKGCGRRNP
jgi:hypothetical protein